MELAYMHFTSFGGLDRESNRASEFSALKLTDLAWYHNNLKLAIGEHELQRSVSLV